MARIPKDVNELSGSEPEGIRDEASLADNLAMILTVIYFAVIMSIFYSTFLFVDRLRALSVLEKLQKFLRLKKRRKGRKHRRSSPKPPARRKPSRDLE